MPKSKNTGIRALLKETGLKKDITAYHLGFVIGPRINACGRVSDARAALELLLTPDQEKATQLARLLSTDNKKRQAIEEEILKDAIGRVNEGRFDEDRVLVIADSTWHEGIVGIVASRMSDQFQKPTVLLTLRQTSAKGSARSVPGFDITDALAKCHDLLSKYGGHSQAAGLEIDRSKIPELRRRLNDFAQGFGPTVFEKKYTYDMKLAFEDITGDVLHFLKYFEPTGVANPQPVFLGSGLEVVGVPRVVGSDHLKFALRSNDCAFEAIAFGQGQMILDIEVGKTRVDCLYSISEDSFFKKKKVVIKIKDIKKV
jgi:single-stranded-DNA-specific exonuclease